jgi:hypothetical protein
MKTPAYRPFINAVGKTVHHLNTIAVGLAGVESGECSKPEGLDVSWNPADKKASSRDARLFMLKSTIVFVAEEVCAYNSLIIGSPNVENIKLPKNPDRSQKHQCLIEHLKIVSAPLIMGPLLLIHWRNKIIHKKSHASLTATQVEDLKNANDEIKGNYKNLCVLKLLDDFERGLPTLKDVSSLIAMTINYVNLVESLIPEPQSKEAFESWLKHIDLYSAYERAQRVAASKPNPKRTMESFIRTNCPELFDVYQYYCT